MTATDIDRLPFLDDLSAPGPVEAHAMNREVLAQSPIARTPYGVAVLGYQEVHAALRDRRLHTPAGLSLQLQGISEGPLWDRTVNGILSLNGEPHTRLRRIVQGAFTPKAAERWRDVMVQVLNRLVDTIAADGEADAVPAITEPYPIEVICALLGTPASDWKLFSGWATDAFKIFNMNVAEEGEIIERAFTEIDAYMDAILEERRREPRDDLLTDLLRAEDEGDRLTHDEVIGLADAVLLAGTDTTRNQLAASLELFARHPGAWARLAREPELATKAVEEAMRLNPVIFGTARITTDDVELAGVPLPEGTFVSVVTSAANRDPSVYDDPDGFDLDRTGPPPHLTFGGGPHYCLGANLARNELAEAFAVLSRRLPDLEVTGPAPWKPVSGISGPTTLPIKFTPAT